MVMMPGLVCAREFLCGEKVAYSHRAFSSHLIPRPFIVIIAGGVFLEVGTHFTTHLHLFYYDQHCSSDPPGSVAV